MRREYKGKPVAYLTVAVGGKACPDSRKIAGKDGFPAFADTHALTARAFGVVVDNADQWMFRIVDAEGNISGTWQSGAKSPNKLRDCIKKGLPKAKWLYADLEVIPQLKKYVDLLELGQYELAIPPLLKLTRAKKEIRTCARAALARVEDIAEKKMAEAEQLLEGGREVDAYFAFNEIASAFTGFDVARDALKQARRLTGRKPVTEELKAMAFYEKALALMRSSKPLERKQAPLFLRQIAKRYEGTRAAALAAKHLEAAR